MEYINTRRRRLVVFAKEHQLDPLLAESWYKIAMEKALSSKVMILWLFFVFILLYILMTLQGACYITTLSRKFAECTESPLSRNGAG
jgi:hypothetical protein